MQERTSVVPSAVVGTTPSKRPTLALVYTLAELMARFGVDSPEALAARFRGAPVAALVAEGARVTTARLTREAPNLIGAAVTIVAQLLPGQRDLLPALDDAFFRAAVTALHVCDARGGARDSARDVAEGVSRGNRSARRGLVARAKTQRKVVYAAASALTGADPARKERLDAAWGSGGEPEHLARSLGDMAAVLRELVADARAKGHPTAVTDDWIAAQEGLAADLARASTQADGRAAVGDVAQGDVAWWRGAALWFLRQMADMIDAAHEADARIARLPLGNLRPVIRRPRAAKKKAKAPDAPKPDAPGHDAPKPAGHDAPKPA